MTLTTYSDTASPLSGLGLGDLPRRSIRARFDRAITRLRVRLALWSVRADLDTIPTYVLADIGIRPDDIDRAVRTATLVVVRRAIRAKLQRTHDLKDGGPRWTS